MQQLEASRAREQAKTQEVVTLKADLQRCNTAMEVISGQINHQLPESQDTKAFVTDLYEQLCDTQDQLDKAKRIARVAFEHAGARSAELAQAREKAADAARAHAEREGELWAGLKHARGVMRGLVKAVVALAAEREQLYVWADAQDAEVRGLHTHTHMHTHTRTQREGACTCTCTHVQRRGHTCSACKHALPCNRSYLHVCCALPCASQIVALTNDL